MSLHGYNLVFDGLPVYLIFNISFYMHLNLFRTYFRLGAVAVKQWLLILGGSGDLIDILQ